MFFINYKRGEITLIDEILTNNSEKVDKKLIQYTLQLRERIKKMLKILLMGLIIISIFIYVFMVGTSIDKTTEKVKKEIAITKKE